MWPTRRRINDAATRRSRARRSDVVGGPPETCSAKIWSQASGDDEFDRGYVTADDDYHWICEQCFADFRKKFNRTVMPSA